MAMIGIIPARGGSKGVPGKALRELAGKPLIAYTIEAAKASQRLDCAIVTTDDEAIADAARQFGADVPFIRPAELATDETPMLPVLQHAARWYEDNHGPVKLVVLMDPTTPMRTASDIDNCIELAERMGADSVVSVCEAEHNPYFVMVELAEGDKMVPLMRPAKPISRRQDAPPVYRINAAVYAIRRDVLLNEGKIFTDNSIAYVMPEERSGHIDTEADFVMTEALVKWRREKEA